MKLWTLNKYWMTYGVITFIVNVLSLMLGLNMLLSLFMLCLFGFGCLLAFASLFKVINGKLNPPTLEGAVIKQNDKGLIDVVCIREKDVLKLQVAPDAPFWWFIQKLQFRGGE